MKQDIANQPATSVQTCMCVVDATAALADGRPFDLETLCRYLESIVPKRLHDILAEPVNPRLY